MNVAISTEGPDLKSPVSRRFGVAPYLLIVNLESGALEAAPNPGSSGQRAAGVHAILLILSKDVQVLLTGYCSPETRRRLNDNAVEVRSGISGIAGDVLRRYKMGQIENKKERKPEARSNNKIMAPANLYAAARRSGRQFISMLPILGGVVLLMGLFNSFFSKELVARLFSGNAVMDAFNGALAGSLFGGNAINSYVLGGELLKKGVSLFAVTALLLTWVTVGLIQLPAEMAALGRRFAILRNVSCFLLAFPIAFGAIFILSLVTGGNS